MTDNIEVLRGLVAKVAERLETTAFNIERIRVVDDNARRFAAEDIRSAIATLNNGLNAALAAMGGQGEGVCHWRQQDESGDWFSTGCGHEFVLNDARQYADGDAPFPFCAYCAKPMRFYRWRDESPCTCDNGDGPECEGCTDNRRCSAISAPQQPEAQAGDIVKPCHDGQPCPKVYPGTQAGGADLKLADELDEWALAFRADSGYANPTLEAAAKTIRRLSTPPAKVPEGGEFRDSVLNSARFRAACYALVGIVEGIEGLGRRWAANGERLKDTREWVAFYNAVAAMRSGTHQSMLAAAPAPKE